ncbi:MAG TPA: hypothetical protein VFV33_03065 [Gemmatimonadaceae bacterium]|nr:hypothetical protein [Gemmatimonadaceae bacterium]
MRLPSTLLAAIAGLSIAASPVRAQQGPINTSSFNADSVLKRLVAVYDSVGKDTLEFKALIDSSADSRTHPGAAKCLADWASRSSRPYSFGCWWPRFRAGSSEAADEFFGAFRVGDAIALGLGSQTTLYTELISDNVWVAGPFGFSRVGLSAQLTANEDEPPATPGSEPPRGSTVEQFFQGGGNAVLYLATPVMSWLNFTNPKAAQLSRRFDVYATLALGADIPAMATTTTDPAGSARFGISFAGFQTTRTDVFRFFVDGGVHAVQGFSSAFYRNLSPTAASAPFVAATATAGVDLAKLVRVGARFGGATLDGFRYDPQLTIQVLPQH